MRLMWVFAVLGILVVAPAQAAPILLQDQHVVYGVQDVLVDDILYDVRFRYGAYSEVFTIPPALMVPYNLEDANGPGGKAYRGTLAVTNLISGHDVSAVGDGFGVERFYFVTPGMIDPNDVIFGVKSEAQGPGSPYLWIADAGAPAFATFDSVLMYAVFTEKTPEPSTLLLSTLGLALAAMRRRALRRA